MDFWRGFQPGFCLADAFTLPWLVPQENSGLHTKIYGKIIILLECSNSNNSKKVNAALWRSVFIIFPVINNLQCPTRFLVLRLQNHPEFAPLNSLLATSFLQNSWVCCGESIAQPGKGDVIMRENETEFLIPPGRGGSWDLELQEGFTWSVEWELHDEFEVECECCWESSAELLVNLWPCGKQEQSSPHGLGPHPWFLSPSFDKNQNITQDLLLLLPVPFCYFNIVTEYSLLASNRL